MLFGGSEVEYLGYVVSRAGISVDLKKVEAVRNFPRSTEVKSLQPFHGAWPLLVR